MCLLCGTAQPTTAQMGWWSEGRIDPTMMFTEVTDVGETTGTAQALAVGDEAFGLIANSTDEDWYAVQVVSGQTYHINLVGNPTGGNALADTFLTIYNSAGTELTSNDDGGLSNFNSYLSYTATYTGTLYVAADAFSSFTGDYMLSVYQDDIPETTATPAVMLVNSTVVGYSTLDGGWDDDWYAVTLQAGTTYTLSSLAFVPAEYTDTFVEFHDSTGAIVSSGMASASFTPTTTGTYYVTSSPNDQAGFGQYELSLVVGGGGGGGWETPNLSEPLASIDWGFTAPTTINVYFAPGGLSFIDSEGSYTTVAWTAQEMAGAEVAFQQFENVANVTFNTVGTAASADFIMVQTDGTGALGYWGVGGGSITLGGTAYNVDGWGVFEATGTGFDDTGTQQGGYGFITLIHEIGHGMGLAHPHDNGGSSSIMTGVTGPFGSYGTYGLNQGIWTTMSYNDGWVTGPIGASPSNDYGWQATMMTLDIAVLQDTYGANTTYNSGNNIYTLPSTNAAGTFYSAIWDTGGTDTIRHVGAAGAIINLNAAPLTNTSDGGGYVSYVGGIHGGFTIANGVVIENATGGSGDDTIIGNAAANTLIGSGGSDIISGGDGNDILDGGEGADVLNGQGGTDRADYTSSAAGLTIDLLATANNTGIAAGDTYVSVENLLGSNHNDTVRGDNAANSLWGWLGNDIIIGRGGSDTLYGGDGNDILDGGEGADVLNGQGGTDRADYTSSAAGLTIDLLATANNTGIAAGDTYVSVENLLGSNHNDTVRGDNAANSLWGWLGNDQIEGQGGNDTLYGGSGQDELVGGAGNDSLYGQADTDTFVFAAGWGNDTICDFANDGLETIDLSAIASATSLASLSIADDGFGNAVVQLVGDASNTIVVLGATAASLGIDDFAFA